MGLDITAYETVTVVSEEELARLRAEFMLQLDSAGPDQDAEDVFRDWLNDLDFQYIRSSGYPTQTGNLAEKWVRLSGATTDFRAGSYSGYNLWRSTLCQLVHGMTAKEFWSLDRDLLKLAALEDTLPFELLICFTDCDGVIGPAAAARLATDFEQHETAILDRLSRMTPQTGYDYFPDLYTQWKEAFRLAAGRGCVRFH